MQAYEINATKLKEDEAAQLNADIPAVSPVPTAPGASGGSGQMPHAFQVPFPHCGALAAPAGSLAALLPTAVVVCRTAQGLVYVDGGQMLTRVQALWEDQPRWAFLLDFALAPDDPAARGLGLPPLPGLPPAVSSAACDTCLWLPELSGLHAQLCTDARFPDMRVPQNPRQPCAVLGEPGARGGAGARGGPRSCLEPARRLLHPCHLR